MEKMIAGKWPMITFLVLGLVLVAVGFFRSIRESRLVQVEYISSSDETSNRKILVDVGGGVISPNVYSLDENARVKDALVAAGGLSVDADRKIVEKMFNLAQTLKDGQKIYVPLLNESDTGLGYAGLENGDKMININTASKDELDTLEGIGPTRAQEIIDNRPYLSIEELVEKGALTKSVFENIKGRITLY